MKLRTCTYGLYAFALVPGIALGHSAQYNAISSAIVDYVHRQHGLQFQPRVTCIKVNAQKTSALAAFEAGPPGDPIATSIVLVRPGSLGHSKMAALSPGHNAPHPIQGWSTVQAFTSAISPPNDKRGRALSTLLQQRYSNCIE